MWRVRLPTRVQVRQDEHMLVTVAEELYALAPAEFTAARNQRAKEAKAAGDPDLAKEIGRLPKPSAAAWAVNLMARQRTEVLRQVIDLGEALRTAQDDLDRDTLKELSRQRQDLIRSVAAAAGALAEDNGQRLPAAATVEVEHTLQAAMADPDAAAAVLTGRLVRTLSSTGVEPVDLSDAVAGPAISPSATTRTEESDGEAAEAPLRGAERRSRATEEQRLEEARQRAKDAEERAAQASEELESLESELEALKVRRTELRAALAEARKLVAELEQDIDAVEDEADNLERGRAAANRAVTETARAARVALDRLERLAT